MWFKKDQGPQGAPGGAHEQGPGGPLGQVRELPADPLQQGARPQLQDLPEVRVPLPPLGAGAAADALRRGELRRSSTRICAPSDPLKFRDTKRYRDRLKQARGIGRPLRRGRRRLRNDGRHSRADRRRWSSSSSAARWARSSARRSPARPSAPSRERQSSDHRLDLGRRAHAGGDPLAHADGARSSAALARLAEARIPYISVMTDPTTGGVTASFAMLGDLNIAEPNALIGFAGPRVIEQTIRQTLPEGFQRSEFLLEHGMLDFVVERSEMKETLVRCLRLLWDGATGRRAGIGTVRRDRQAARRPTPGRRLAPSRPALAALARLESLSLRGMRLGLAAIDAICERLGPARAARSLRPRRREPTARDRRRRRSRRSRRRPGCARGSTRRLTSISRDGAHPRRGAGRLAGASSTRRSRGSSRAADARPGDRR